MNVRNIRGPNCCEASVSVTIMTEKTTPTTVMRAPASAARISLAASGEPLITQEGRLSWRWKAAWSTLSVSTNRSTAATLSTAGISHRFVRSVSLRQSDSTPNRLKPTPNLPRLALVVTLPTRLPGAPELRVSERTASDHDPGRVRLGRHRNLPGWSDGSDGAGGG